VSFLNILSSGTILGKGLMATPINAPMAGEIWHLSIEDLFQPVQEAPRLGGNGPFVINLSVSTAPISVLTKPFAGNCDAHVYQIQVTEDGRARFRLRLGPFATEDEAEAILAEVRETYPGALTATANDSDLRVIRTMQEKAEARRSGAQKSAQKPAPQKAVPEKAAPQKAVPQRPVPQEVSSQKPASQKDAPRAAAPAIAAAEPDADISIDITWLVTEPVIPPATLPRAVPNIHAAAPKMNTASTAPPPREPAPARSRPELNFPPPNVAARPLAKVAPVLTEVAAPVVKPAAPKIVAPTPPTVAPAPERSRPESKFRLPTVAASPVARLAPVLTEVAAPVVRPAAPKIVAPTPPAVAPAPERSRPESKFMLPTVAAGPVARLAPVLTEVAAPVVKPAAPKIVAPTPPVVTAAPYLPKSDAPVANKPAHVADKPAHVADKPAPAADKRAPLLTQSVASPPKPSATKQRQSTFNTSPTKLTSLQHVAVATAPAPASREVKELDKPLQTLDSTQTVRALTPLELDDDEASHWFIIQLALADHAFDPDAVPDLDIFDEYRLYSVAGLDQGRDVHALRLGFFREEMAAVAVSSYLAAFWNEPTIKRVSVAERERFADQRVEARKDVGATGRHAVIEITDELVARRRRTSKPPISGKSSSHPSGN
jgi:hypothetical protein